MYQVASWKMGLTMNESVIYQYVIYERPSDYPGQYVLRQWNIGAGTAESGKILALAETIEEVRASIPVGTTLLPIHDPDPVIVEVWM